MISWLYHRPVVKSVQYFLECYSYFDDVDQKLFKKEDLPVSTTKRYMRGNVNMEIIFDVSYLEIYADGGLETASVCVYPDAPYQVVSTDGDLEVKMYTIKK